MHKVFNAIAIQNFKLSSSRVLVWPYVGHSISGLAPTDCIRVFVATQASYVQLPVVFSHN